MAQITIYLPDKLETKARRAAKAKGESVSRWIADQIGRGLNDSWPPTVLSAAGAVPEFPDLTDLRKSYGKDGPREI